jgi:type II secretion system protein H
VERKVKVTKSVTGSEAPTQTRESGFSLLELILVLVVMSLVLTMVYPSMSRGKTAFHLRAVGRDVVNALRVARESAVTEQKVMLVLVDSQAQQVTVSDEVGDGPRTFHPPDDVKILGLSGTGEEQPQGQLVIRFLPNGSSEDAQILVKADSGASLRIILDPITGGARILSTAGEKAP